MTVLFLCMWTLLTASRGTPLGKDLDRLMVELPAERLARVSRGQMLLTVTLAGVAGFLVWVGGQDLVAMIGMGAPDVLAWLAIVDASALVEGLMAAAAALSIMRFRTVQRQLVAMTSVAFRSMRSGRRTRSVRLRSSKAMAANDDDGLAGLATAA